MGGMSTDWLSQLAPAHAPPVVGWWPPAPGWWSVAVLILVVVAAVTYWYVRPAQRLRRAALRELKRIETGEHDDARLAAALNGLLRRYAVAVRGREAVAHLSGENWLVHLVEHGGKELAGEPGRSLLRVAYGGRAPAERDRWLKGSRDFLRSRR
jgi:hypothetical protein